VTRKNPFDEQRNPRNARVKTPASGSWLKNPSREALAARLSQGLFRNALKVHPESSSPAIKAVITAVTGASVGRESCFCNATRNPVFFSRAATSRQAFSVPVRGMARKGGNQKFTPDGCPPPPSRSPCQDIKVIPPKTNLSPAIFLPPLSGKNSGRPPSGAKHTTR